MDKYEALLEANKILHERIQTLRGVVRDFVPVNTALEVLAEDDSRAKRGMPSTFTLHAVTSGREALIDYTNWKGQRAERTILPLQLWYGTTEQHPEPQWIVRAVDSEKQLLRDFTLHTIHYWG